MENLDELKIELNASISVDQRRYNAPAMEQVATIRQDGSDEKVNSNEVLWFIQILGITSKSGKTRVYCWRKR